MPGEETFSLVEAEPDRYELCVTAREFDMEQEPVRLYFHGEPACGYRTLRLDTADLLALYWTLAAHLCARGLLK